jgi:hypothetical protein
MLADGGGRIKESGNGEENHHDEPEREDWKACPCVIRESASLDHRDGEATAWRRQRREAQMSASSAETFARKCQARCRAKVGTCSPGRCGDLPQQLVISNAESKILSTMFHTSRLTANERGLRTPCRVLGTLSAIALAAGLTNCSPGPQGQPGPQGPPGEPGPAGPAASSQLRIVSVPCDETKCTAQCNPDEFLWLAYCGNARNAAIYPNDGLTATCRVRAPANNPLVISCVQPAGR